jgi:hypothetical protein
VIGGRVLDATAVLDLATGTSIYGQALLSIAAEQAIPLAIPAVALQAAWQRAPVQGRPWLELLPELPTVVVLALGAADARDAGMLAAAAQRPDAAPGTAHAVHIARHRGWPVVTTDPDAVLALDPEIRTETIP